MVKMHAVPATLAVLAFFAFAGLSSAQGEFTCPPGESENLQCAASCCEQYGGTYSYSGATCEVDSSYAWNSAAQCEQLNGCCEPSSPAPGACCGPAFLLGALVPCAVALSGSAGRRRR